jgi:hypothetical protein
MMMEQGISPGTHPREQFKKDLTAYVAQLHSQGHNILLMGDFNETLDTEDTGMALVAQAGQLQDLMALRTGRTDFNTFINGTQRIDYVLASPAVVQACTAAGYDPFKIRFQGDHRGMFMDFDTTALFGNITPALAPPSRRNLTSKHEPNRLKYLGAKYKYLKDHQWFIRLKQAQQLPSRDPTLPELLESLDRDWVRASLHAEKQCVRHRAPPYVIQLANMRPQLQAVKLQLSILRWHKPMDQALEYALSKCPPGFILPETQEELQVARNTLSQQIKAIEKDAVTARKQEQDLLLEAQLEAGDKAGAKALRNIIIAEETKEMWKQLRALDSTADQGVTTVQIPSDGNFSS